MKFETEIEKARKELEQLRAEKDKAEQRDRDDFKRELKYRLSQTTTRYRIPKQKTTIAKRNAAIRTRRLENYAFSLKQSEIAQRILANMEGTK